MALPSSDSDGQVAGLYLSRHVARADGFRAPTLTEGAVAGGQGQGQGGEAGPEAKPSPGSGTRLDTPIQQHTQNMVDGLWWISVMESYSKEMGPSAQPTQTD